MVLLIDVLYSVAILASSIGVASLSWVLLKRLAARMAAKTSTPIDDIVIHTVRAPLYLSIILAGANLALRRLGVFAEYLRYLDIVFLSIWALILGYLFYRFVDMSVPALGRKAELPNVPIEVIRRTLRWIVVAATLVSLMTIAGVDMGGVVGIIMLVLGTIVFLAFAAWSIMGNVTAGIVLMIWRPFEIGDYIQLEPEGIRGRVEDINLMFVKVAAPTGETIHIPNTLVMQKSIINLSKLGRYLIKLEYKTSMDKDPEAIRWALLKAASATKGVLKNPEPTVSIKELSSDSVAYELNAYTSIPSEAESIMSDLRLNVIKQLKEL